MDAIFISQKKNIIISFSGCFNVLFQIIHCFARKMKLFLIGMKKISQTFRFMDFSTLIFCLFYYSDFYSFDSL